MKLWNKRLDKLNRALHRDLGYLFIGLTLIYGLSGIAVILQHLDINIAYRKLKTEKVIATNLSAEQLRTYWMSSEGHDLPKYSKIIPDPQKDSSLFIRVKGGEGYYNPATGNLTVSVYKTNKLVKFVNDIHYNVGGRFTWLGIVYACILLFFAISGAIIVKGKKSFMRRGVWFTLVGIIIPLLTYFFL